MNGLILLDEEQQRTLYARTHPPHRSQTAQAMPRRPAPPPPPSHHRPRSHMEPTQSFRGDTHCRGPAGPRTDFTTSSSAHQIRVEFTNNLGQPRSDFKTRRSSAGNYSVPTSDGRKPSTATHCSSTDASVTADFTDDPSEMALGTGQFDSYPPILRDDVARLDSTATSSHEAAAQYAGTSSGLKISVRWILVGLVFGLMLGLLLSEIQTSSVTARWIALPGDLFLRTLKCLVMPYIFCSVAVAVGDIVFVGKVSVIGFQTAKIFVLFWVATVTMGILVALMFRPYFNVHKVTTSNKTNAMGFVCGNANLLTTTSNGTVACSTTNATRLDATTTFSVVDTDAYFVRASSSVAALSLSDQLLQTITPIVSKNIVASLANGELMSIMTFSMLLGTIAGHNYFTKSRRVNYIYLSLLQLRNTFFLMMEWTIWLSPGAVVSIVAGAFATNKNFLSTFGDVYPYLLAAISATLLQMLFVYPLIVFFMTSTNPYTHMNKMLRAYMFAFACASSLATMPVTLSCVKAARSCSQSVANFVISVGVASNVSAMGFYVPIALVFLAESSGNGDQLTVGRIIGIFALSLLTCAGTPPIPAAGLVVISTAYTTLFGPISTTMFAYVVAMDVFFDRFVTVCNVNDDIMALKIISETTDETVVQDHLGERF